MKQTSRRATAEVTEVAALDDWQPSREALSNGALLRTNVEYAPRAPSTPQPPRAAAMGLSMTPADMRTIRGHEMERGDHSLRDTPSLSVPRVGGGTEARTQQFRHTGRQPSRTPRPASDLSHTARSSERGRMSERGSIRASSGISAPRLESLPQPARASNPGPSPLSAEALPYRPRADLSPDELRQVRAQEQALSRLPAYDPARLRALFVMMAPDGMGLVSASAVENVLRTKLNLPPADAATIADMACVDETREVSLHALHTALHRTADMREPRPPSPLRVGRKHVKPFWMQEQAEDSGASHAHTLKQRDGRFMSVGSSRKLNAADLPPSERSALRVRARVRQVLESLSMPRKRELFKVEARQPSGAEVQIRTQLSYDEMSDVLRSVGLRTISPELLRQLYPSPAGSLTVSQLERETMLWFEKLEKRLDQGVLATPRVPATAVAASVPYDSQAVGAGGQQHEQEAALAEGQLAPAQALATHVGPEQDVPITVLPPLPPLSPDVRAAETRFLQLEDAEKRMVLNNKYLGCRKLVRQEYEQSAAHRQPIPVPGPQVSGPLDDQPVARPAHGLASSGQRSAEEEAGAAMWKARWVDKTLPTAMRTGNAGLHHGTRAPGAYALALRKDDVARCLATPEPLGDSAAYDPPASATRPVHLSAPFAVGTVADGLDRSPSTSTRTRRLQAAGTATLGGTLPASPIRAAASRSSAPTADKPWAPASTSAPFATDFNR